VSESAPLCGGGVGRGRTGMLLFNRQLARGFGGPPAVVSACCKPPRQLGATIHGGAHPSPSGLGVGVGPTPVGAGPPRCNRFARRWSCVVCGPFLLDTLCPTWGRPHRRSSFPAGPTRERPKSRFPSMGCLMRHRQTSLRLRVAFHSPDLPWQYWFGFGLWHCMSLAFNPL